MNVPRSKLELYLAFRFATIGQEWQPWYADLARSFMTVLLTQDTEDPLQTEATFFSDCFITGLGVFEKHGAPPEDLDDLLEEWVRQWKWVQRFGLETFREDLVLADFLESVRLLGLEGLLPREAEEATEVQPLTTMPSLPPQLAPETSQPAAPEPSPPEPVPAPAQPAAPGPSDQASEADARPPMGRVLFIMPRVDTLPVYKARKLLAKAAMAWAMDLMPLSEEALAQSLWTRAQHAIDAGFVRKDWEVKSLYSLWWNWIRSQFAAPLTFYELDEIWPALLTLANAARRP